MSNAKNITGLTEMANTHTRQGWSWASIFGIFLLILAACSLVYSKSIAISPGWDDLGARAIKWQWLSCGYLLFGAATLIGVTMLVKHGFRNLTANLLQVAIVVALGAYLLVFVFWPTTDMLVASVADNDLKRAKRCLDWGVDVDQRVSYSVENLYSTPLAMAVEQGNLAMVDLLLSTGADPISDGRGQRLFPLTQSWEIRDRLLAAGEDINSEWNGKSFLEHAILFSQHPRDVESDSNFRWQEVQAFLSRGAGITDDVREASLVDLNLARHIEKRMLAEGHTDTEPRWRLFRALLLGQNEVARSLLMSEPKFSEFPKSADLKLAVRCEDISFLREWVPRIEASHRYRTSFILKIINEAATIAEQQGNQGIVELLTASAARLRD